MLKNMSKLQLALEMLALAFILGGVMYAAVSWQSMPDVIPVHFDINGNPDGYGSKWNIVAVAVICIIIYGGIAVCQHYPQSWNIPVKVTDENRDKVYELVKIYIVAMKAVVSAAFSHMLVCAVRGVSLGLWFTIGSIGLPILIISVGIYRCRKI